MNGKKYKVVSPNYLKEGVEVNDEVEKVKQQGKTVVFLVEDRVGEVEDNKPIAAIALADIVREESKEAIKRLKEMGLKCMMLTGDNAFVAKWVAEEIGLDEYFAEVLPHEKADKIREIQRKYTVAMVGDGVNDAPACSPPAAGALLMSLSTVIVAMNARLLKM